jgi:KaiC/GvpD/RAD55 family RecA-like ATPase
MAKYMTTDKTKHVPLDEKEINKVLNDGNILSDWTLNKRLEEAKDLPPMKEIFGSLLFESEVCVLAGDTGKGKTTLAMQIAIGASGGENILEQQNTTGRALTTLYYSFEMKIQQLKRRLGQGNIKFPDKLLCPDIKDVLGKDGTFNIQKIRQDVIDRNVDFVILDNITAIALKGTTDQNEALRIMKGISEINLELGTTFLVVAHTPKIYIPHPLTVNDIAGSKLIANFIDSAIMLGESSKDAARRYIKQVKCRSDQELSGVLVIDIIYEEDFLSFKFVEYDVEKNHVPEQGHYNKGEERIEHYKNIVSEYFIGDGLRYTEFVKQYQKQEGKSESRAKQVFKDLEQKFNLVVKNPIDEKKYISNI